MSEKGKKILGLDLGTASIGWALAYDCETLEDCDVLAMGVRSFEEPVEDKSREPKNQKRRAARLARRNLFRRAQRKMALKQLLIQNQLAPSSPNDETNWHSLDPFILRSKGLTEKLSLFEFGRAIYHLGQRRGFLSNRKAKLAEKVGIPEIDELIELDEAAELERSKSKPDKKAEEGPVLTEIALLQEQITESSAKTLGQFFLTEIKNNVKIRSRHTLRSMFIEEFELLWSAQASHYPQKLTDPLKARIYKVLFHQRPLKDQSGKRAKCPLEPGKQVTYRAHPFFQEMRIWQDLANIKLTETKNWTERFLTKEEMTIVAKVLEYCEKPSSAKGLTWDKFRTLLNLPKKEHLLINLEQGKNHTVLELNKTNQRLNDSTKGEWLKYSTQQREQVFEIILENTTDATKLRRLVNEVKIKPEHAYQIVITPLPDGTANYSLKAIRKILEQQKKGFNHYQAKIESGYTPEHEIETKAQNKLEFQELPASTNPGVNKCLHESRKLINAIIRKYGMPDKIVVELGRDLSLNREAKLEILKKNKANQKLNEEAYQAFTRHYPNSKPSRNDIVKYGLWIECDGVCPYTGKAILLTELWTKNWEIEHIVPFSISLDDSFNNKTLAPSEVNAKKSNRLPSEYFAGRPQEWDAALERVQKFKSSYHKKKLFGITRDKLPEDFHQRQLNDTRYASRLVRDYVKTLGIEVASATGKHTADLRRHWGLHNILDESGEKNRDDHRHHAIDALTTALTTPKLVKQITELYKEGGSLQNPLDHQKVNIPLPWPNLRNDCIDAVNQIIVSHEPQHKIRGALHEETGYGRRKSDGSITTRKALADLKYGDILRIVDPNLRASVIQAIQESGIPISSKSESKSEKWSKEQENTVRGILDNFQIIDSHGCIHKINRAKIFARGQDESRYFKTNRGLFPSGSNQWLLILEKEDSSERTAVVVPLWQAAQLKHKKLGPETLVPPGWNLLFVLHKQDMLYLTDGSGPYRLAKMSGENQSDVSKNKVDLSFLIHRSALTVDDATKQKKADPKFSYLMHRIVSREKLKLLMPPVRIGMLGPE